MTHNTRETKLHGDPNHSNSPIRRLLFVNYYLTYLSVSNDHIQLRLGRFALERRRSTAAIAVFCLETWVVPLCAPSHQPTRISED